ncbi:hypothetical protein PAXRUDRAFT_23077 [Paxillus rubicundulus Ve08.2h10]|uniref:Uncharacterized protein n=1 Tax=Paxillus rubicundulus Ve08.2h10 TaxID=930991 RepID=A0A0D0EDB4_9AGAM|nr:hypothetical protein PAXRUDRAFT_23077 [Paxillus rubicundulus Ve08.2h10]
MLHSAATELSLALLSRSQILEVPPPSMMFAWVQSVLPNGSVPSRCPVIISPLTASAPYLALLEDAGLGIKRGCMARTMLTAPKLLVDSREPRSRVDKRSLPVPVWPKTSAFPAGFSIGYWRTLANLSNPERRVYGLGVERLYSCNRAFTTTKSSSSQGWDPPSFDQSHLESTLRILLPHRRYGYYCMRVTGAPVATMAASGSRLAPAFDGRSETDYWRWVLIGVSFWQVAMWRYTLGTKTWKDPFEHKT